MIGGYMENCNFYDEILLSQKYLNQFVKTTDRYKDFIILNNGVPFADFFKDKNISRVQLHSITPCGKNLDDIVGFCGKFKWESNELSSLDGDSYNKNMTIFGYSWFKDKNGNQCLNILVRDDW